MIRAFDKVWSRKFEGTKEPKGDPLKIDNTQETVTAVVERSREIIPVTVPEESLRSRPRLEAQY